MQLKLAREEQKTEREAWMGAGPGAVVCCSVAAVPRAAAPAAGGWLGARTPAGNRLSHPAGHSVALNDAQHRPGPRGWAGVKCVQRLQVLRIGMLKFKCKRFPRGWVRALYCCHLTHWLPPGMALPQTWLPIPKSS